MRCEPLPQQVLAPSLRFPVAPAVLHRVPPPEGLHPTFHRLAPVARASDAVHFQATWSSTFLLVRSFACGFRPRRPGPRLLRPLLTSRSRLPRRPFRHKTRSPQVRTRSFPARPPDLRHLALTTRASRSIARSPCSAPPCYPFLVHRPAVSFHASFPHSVTLMQLRFPSFTVVSLREDFHLQDRAHAGRTTKPRHGAWSVTSDSFCFFLLFSLVIS